MSNYKKERCCFVLLVFFACWGLEKAFGKAAGAGAIHAAISLVSKNPISYA